MSRKILIIIAIILSLILGTIFVLRVFTPEDSWICQDSTWVRHGNPDGEAPTTRCQ